jgi:hypothetical protein
MRISGKRRAAPGRSTDDRELDVVGGKKIKKNKKKESYFWIRDRMV